MKKDGFGEDADQDFTNLLWINPSARMVRQEVADRLRSAITLGRFKPGQRLLERELCEWTGVSRTSVREALRQLESEGLVENLPRRGPAVSVITPDKVKDIYEVRMSVEPDLTRLFIERATDDETDELVKAADELEKAARSGNPAEISSVKTRFYDVLMAGCGNSTLEDVVRSLHFRLALVKSTYLQHPERWAQSARELKALAGAIKAKDVKRATKLCDEHLAKAVVTASAGATSARQLPDGCVA